MDEPDGTTDMVIQYEGCPLATVRGTDDMSCIDNDEDEERAVNECKANALFIIEACNNYYKLKEQNEKFKDALEHITRISEDHGIAGCTYGDTKFDSESAAYGYNSCREYMQDIAEEALKSCE